MLKRYEQAQTLHQGTPINNRLVRNDTVYPHWIPYTDQSISNYFWYRRQTVEGKEYRLVDADAASNTLAFDHDALASALSNALEAQKETRESTDTETDTETDSATKTTQKTIDPLDLPLKFVSITMEKRGAPLQLHFQALNKYWFFNPDNSELEEAIAPPSGALSPDGKKIVFVRDYNIWIRDQSSGEEQPLTKDGEEKCRHGHHLWGEAIPVWSADSQSILFTQLDEQKVRTIPHVNYGPTNNGSYYPEVTTRTQAYPGDEHISSLRLCAIDIATGQLQRADYPAIPYRCCGVMGMGLFEAGLAWWSADNQRAFFVDTPRDSKIVRVVEWNTQSGATRVVFEQTDDITVRLRYEYTSLPIIYPLPETDELIWFSERSGWGHLYLYDLNSGELKHQITGAADSNGGEPLVNGEFSTNGEPSANKNGEWLVRNILHVDTEKRELLLQTAARNPDVSPYYQDICKVNIDSGALTPLVEGDFDFAVNHPLEFKSFAYKNYTFSDGDSGVSPSGQYLVTTASRVDTAPVSTLIDRDGKEILTIETCDVSSLPNDWQWPEPVKLKGADNTTDIYAVVFRPPGFSPEKSYPVVDFISSMRGISALPTGSFANNVWAGYDYFGAAALATLGFVVVTIAGRGTPLRDKAFYTHHYGDHAFTSDLTDRIAGLRQLAERYPYMDLERVGLSANENASNNAIYGSLLHSDFYKVTVIHCMPDPRFWMACLSEEFDIQISPSPTAPPKTPYPEDCVESFSGKLLLILGMGFYAFHQPTFLLADALKKANKDFDMLCIPDMHHTVCSYTHRREWDYLVTHLQGAEPPKQFELISGLDLFFVDQTPSFLE
tara:strand:- start:439 stop:2946 length:2508 start_codon:yes stop_codon:yes gene_type:complete